MHDKDSPDKEARNARSDKRHGASTQEALEKGNENVSRQKNPDGKGVNPRQLGPAQPRNPK